jgi:glycosyltransferase involved in cell wall biosynthesis
VDTSKKPRKESQPSARLFNNISPAFISTKKVAKQGIKLSVITQFFPPDYAPTGQLIEELVHQLGQQGVDIEVMTGQPGYAFQSATAPAVETMGSVKIKRSRFAQLWPQRIRGKAVNGVLFSLRALLYLFRAWRHRNVVLLTTAPPFLPILGYIANRLLGISYICLIYDLYPDIAVELGVVPERHGIVRFWRKVNQLVWRRASGLIVLSPAMKARITTYCPAVADKISVIHSWANSDAIVPLAKEENWFAQEHQLVDRFTVLYSGNMGRCHDMETLLQAAYLLKDDPIQFVCIGGGAQREPVMKQVSEWGLSNFLFLPYQDKQVLPYSLTACDLSLVSVSPGMEDLVAPSKLYSALSAGRPIAVVCPSHSYLNPLIAEAECGATFANGDAEGLAKFIRFLSGDRPQSQKMGTAGRRYLLTHFTPEQISKQYFRVFQQTVSQKRKRVGMMKNL